MVLINEPWEFIADVQKNSIEAVIEQVSIRIAAKADNFSESEAILIRIMKPFACKTRKFEYLLASPRYFGKGLRELMSGGDISFNFLRIPEHAAKSADPFQADDDWRGGHDGFVGTILLPRIKNGRL